MYLSKPLPKIGDSNVEPIQSSRALERKVKSLCIRIGSKKNTTRGLGRKEIGS